VILHILSRAQWNEAVRRGSYSPASLDTEGFIHCSRPEQVLGTANRFFRGQRDLLILSIDEPRLAAPLKYEPPAPADGGEPPDARFPHLYGPLNLDAVVRAAEFPCGPDGSFADFAPVRRLSCE
jgi:uncharacterized protein (DUF952 family)